MVEEKQIAEIERRMREEHRLDLEALQRLKKYLPANGTEPSTPTAATSAPSRPTRSKMAPTGLTATVLSIIASDNARIWTRRDIESQLDGRDFVIHAKDKVAAVNQALKSLVGRDQVELVRKGSGSLLAQYRYPKSTGFLDNLYTPISK